MKIHYTKVPVYHEDDFIYWVVTVCGRYVESDLFTNIKGNVTCKNCLRILNAKKNNNSPRRRQVMKKKLKSTTISSSLLQDFNCKTIEEVINLLNKYKKNYPDLINLRFKLEYDYELWELHLIADRWETDAELATRIKKSESARKVKKELAELKLLEELKEKYETSNYKKPR